MAAGASLSVAWRWTDRLIGLVSMPILARILVPEDFGLVAMAMIVVGLVDVLFDLGVNVALIQNRNAVAEHFDTAWTLRFLQGLAVAALVVLAAWPSAAYFGDSRLVPVMHVIALASAIAGLENIGIVMLQRNFEFVREFRYFMARRVLSFVITIGLALALESYWALVIGSLAGRIVGVVLSYTFHAFRPRPTLARFREILAVSQWLLVRGILGYVLQKLDQLILGRFGGPAQVGAYSVGAEIAALPSTELLAPLSRVLFPAFVSAQGDGSGLARAIRLALSVQGLLAIPAGVGLALVAPEAVMLLLGRQWMAAVPVVQALALMSLLSPLSYTSNYAMLAEGRFRLLTFLVAVQIVMLLAVCVPALPAIDASFVAFARLGTSALMTLVVTSIWLRAPMAIGWIDVFASSWRPLLATAVMAGAVTAADAIAIGSATGALAIKVAAGATAYVTAVLVLWQVTGRPSGGETYLLEKLTPAVDLLRRKLGGRPGEPRA